jgi:steroid 5-alpha reductase family enzyme
MRFLMTSTLITTGLLGLFLSAAMTFAFGLRLLTGRSGWIDTIWSGAVGLAGLLAVWGSLGAGISIRQACLAALIGLWSLRLAGHIGQRTMAAKDDPRYGALVAEWGPAWRWRLYLFLQAQAIAGLVLVGGVQAAALNGAPFSPLRDGLGLLIGLGGLLLEALADRQLRAWKRLPDAAKGSICDVGLWGRSRHPNYLGEIIFWCALPILAFEMAAPHLALVALAAPALMAHLLVNVSGIPPLEAHMERSRGDAWADYCRRVPRLLPRLRTHS